jgi:hypothetical protein
MKSRWLLMIALVLSMCSCSSNERSEVRPRSNGDQPQAVTPEDPEIKAATPEDPGSMATVIVPLEILKKQPTTVRTDPEAALPQESLPIDHPVYLEAQKPKNFLHKVFSVSNRAQCIFMVPPHQGNVRLRGTFRSFTKRSDPDSTSDRTAAIDLLLLNEQEFTEFLHGGPQSVTYELDSANNQRVDWHVPGTYAGAQTYHLIFSNSAGGAKIKFVQADFTVSFE